VAFEPLGVYHCLARETGELVFYGEPPELADFFAQLMREEG
jgi:hypothetical protein